MNNDLSSNSPFLKTFFYDAAVSTEILEGIKVLWPFVCLYHTVEMI